LGLEREEEGGRKCTEPSTDFFLLTPKKKRGEKKGKRRSGE